MLLTYSTAYFEHSYKSPGALLRQQVHSQGMAQAAKAGIRVTPTFVIGKSLQGVITDDDDVRGDRPFQKY